MYLAICILFGFLPSIEATISAVVGNRTPDRIGKCFEAIQRILYPQCLRSGIKACLVSGDDYFIFFFSPLLTLPLTPIPTPVILSEPSERDLFLWEMESSLRGYFI